jgi:hypothetical protein
LSLLARTFHARLSADLSARSLSFPHPINRIGHQGLFFERFDGDYTTLTVDVTNAGMYYNRNRFYSPTLGRFIQRDPNETALPIMTALAMNGESWSIATGGLDAQALYGDGMNLYGYLSSNPVNRSDPSGLFSLPEISMGGAINAGLFALNVGGPIMDGYNYFKMFRDGAAMHQIMMAMAFDAAMNWTGGKAFDVAFDLLKASANAFRSGAKAIALRVLSRMCFAEGTLIAMADGTTQPIELVEVGDLVSCDFDPEANNGYEVSRVARLYRNSTSEVLELCVESDDGAFTVTTTPEHPFYVDALNSYVPAGKIEVGTQLTRNCENSVTFRSAFSRSQATIVYNLEVLGAHNFVVALPNNGPRLLVHNRCVGHHTIPKQILEMLDPAVRNKMKGLRGPRKIIWQIDEEVHKSLHGAVGDGFRNSGSSMGNGGGAWNARWRAEIHASGRPPEKLTLEELLEMRDRIAREFGLAPPTQ